MSRQLRAEFDSILRNWGHNIILQRKESGGFNDVLEKHTVRHMHPGSSGLTDVAHERIEGLVHDVDRIYYFRQDANPKEGDRVYDNDPSIGTSVYTIDFAEPLRGMGGEIVYWTVGATRTEPN